MEVSAHVMNDASLLQDTVSISLKLSNGSIASISYFSNGNKDLSKEHIEVFNGGLVMVLNDFKELTSYAPRGTKTIKSTQDKGHKQEIAEFIACIKEGKPTPVSFQNIYNSTLSTFKVIESIKQKGINLSIAPL